MTLGRLVEAEVSYEDKEGTGVQYYWAVQPPEDVYEFHGGLTWVSEPSPSFVLFGGRSVHIHDEDDIKGLRRLLDRIEEEMK